MLPEPKELIPKVAAKVMNNPDVQLLKAQISSFYSANLGWFRAISVLIVLFFIISIIYFALKTGWMANRTDRVRDIILKTNLPKRRSIKVWQEVQKHFFAGDDNGLRLAIIEADKILDEALRLGGYKGENLGERLKKITSTEMPNIDEVWEAHKLRNRIVHEQDFKINRDTAERALAIYQKTFQDLGLLE